MIGACQYSKERNALVMERFIEKPERHLKKGAAILIRGGQGEDDLTIYFKDWQGALHKQRREVHRKLLWRTVTGGRAER